MVDFEARRSELEKIQADKLAYAQKAADALNGLTIQMTEKAGVDGRLFGSVTNFSVADALKAQGHEVDRSMVRMPDGPMKTVGDYKIEVSLHSDVTAEVNVSVLGETD